MTTTRLGSIDLRARRELPERFRDFCRDVAGLWSGFAAALLLGAFASGLLSACKAKEEALAPTPVMTAPVPAPAPPGAAERKPKKAAPAQPAPPADPLAQVDQFLASMKSANIAFNSPPVLNLSDTAQIQLLLSLKQSVAALQREIAATGTTQGASVKVADRMEARLTGPNFQITAITDEEQAIGANDDVEWKWEIKPLATGHQNLHLTLSAIFNVDGAATHRSIRTFDNSIDVEITQRQMVQRFVQNNWQWLWATVLLPVAGWLWKRRLSKKAGAGN
jgi:hypothetical protein